MNNPELISLIIPCYNAESTIIKCLTSVISQNYQSLEIIIIDDGSTDRTSILSQKKAHKLMPAFISDLVLIIYSTINFFVTFPLVVSISAKYRPFE